MVFDTMVAVPYSVNPFLPRLRALAVRRVRESGAGVRQTARHVGVAPSTVSRWMRKAPAAVLATTIPTQSSRPHSCPHATPDCIVERILVLRRTYGRCAEVVHAQLAKERLTVSLSTVKRILYRHGLIARRSPYKHWHVSGERPKAEKAGDLVEMDSIHLWVAHRLENFIVTVLDCFSRWAYARAMPRLSSERSVRVLFEARQLASFPIATVQSDYGSEFSSYFTQRVEKAGMRHRHIRVRQPNDNAHIERFNRTLQEELAGDLLRYRDNVRRLNESLGRYLTYYNEERLHLGLGCSTPAEVLRRS